MKKPLNRFLIKVLLFALILTVFFETLFRLGFAPIVTNSTFFDQKMLAVQKQSIKNVKLLAMGSSVALYELNSKIIARHIELPYYNFASWGLQITDTKALLTSFVSRYHPRYVILCSSIGDFITPRNETYLNYVNACDFIKNDMPECFYFTNYNSVYQVVRRKLITYPIALDQWGGASLSIKEINKDKWNEHNIFPTRYTPGNYLALESLASFLKTQKVKLIFIQVPLKKSYANTHQSQRLLSWHFERCRSIVEAQGGTYLNYYNTAVFADNLFTDQYHLLNEGSIILTKEILRDLKGIVR